MEDFPRRNHHTTPRHYLKGFADRKDSAFIWVYQKGREYYPGKQHLRLYSPCHMSLSKAGTIRDFYAQKNNDGTDDYDSIEKLLEKIEQPGQIVIDKIRAKESINDSEKRVLSEYMSHLFKRVEYQRSDPNGNWKPTKDQMLVRLEREIEEQCKLYSDKPKIVSNLREAFQLTKSEYTDKPTPKILNQLLFLRYERVIDSFYRMKWTFLLNKTLSPLLTSDNPIYFTRGAGLEKSDLTFPISSDLVLCLSWHNKGVDFTDLKEQFMKTINRRTVAKATRFVYASVNQEWISSVSNRLYPESELLRI